MKSEPDLLSKLKNQDSQAFGELVRVYQSRIINLCYRFLGDQEEAEDTAQEVFMEVHRSIGRYRGESKLSTWIYRIAISKSLDQLRKKKRKKRLVLIQHIFGNTLPIDQVPAPAESQPEQELEKEERLQILQQAVNSLSQNQRIAVTLAKIEGLASKQVAEIMGLSLSSVESLLHRGRANLKKKLKNYYENRK